MKINQHHHTVEEHIAMMALIAQISQSLIEISKELKQIRKGLEK